MSQLKPASAAESRVLRWFLTAFFVSAAIVIATTWLKKSTECSSSCAASGHLKSDLELSGGGRLAMSVVCKCSGAPTGNLN
jgi:hypothetical protein